MSNPSRSRPGLIVYSTRPYNAEPTLDRLVASFVTPVADFYVRSHGDIPALDEAGHRVSVGGRVATPLEFSVDELRERFPRRTVQAVMQCAGNRRADLHRVRPVSGDPWAGGAIGNAAWTGAPLAAVLEAAGAERSPGLHVAFAACDACDADGATLRYGASIPLAKALSPGGAARLRDERRAAHARARPPAPRRGAGLRRLPQPEMARRHRGPGRPVGQPDAGQRLQALSARRHRGHGGLGARAHHRRDAAQRRDLRAGGRGGAAAGAVTVRGWAVASGRAVARVDLSADGGRTWRQAELERDGDAPWSWVFWRAALDLPAGEHELAVRAWDSAGQTQPDRPDDLWNFKGYLSAAWHRVRVRVG